jgi:hypothetical protein
MLINQKDTRSMTAALRLRRAERPGKALLEALMTITGDRGEILRHGQRPWSSTTFAGTRHTIAMRFAGEAVPAGETLVAELPEYEFSILGQLVADAAVIQVEHELLPVPTLTIELELLLLQEA